VGQYGDGGIVNIVSKAPEPGHMDVDVSAGSYRTLSATASAGVALGKDVVAGISASDTTSDGYNKTPEAYRNPAMAATSSNNRNVSATIRATPSVDSSLYVTAMWHSLRMQDLVWSGTQNRWNTWRITFGGDKAVGRGKLSLNGWYGGAA
jgi:outer membrane cobalamin receptor